MGPRAKCPNTDCVTFLTDFPILPDERDTTMILAVVESALEFESFEHSQNINSARVAYTTSKLC